MAVQDTYYLSKEGRIALRAENRARAWEWIKKTMKPDISVWRLEWTKASIDMADDRLVLLPMPSNIRECRISRLRVAFGVVVGFSMAVAYMLRQRGGVGQAHLPSECSLIAAIHPEWSSRSRHLLTAIDTANPAVEAIILLGRLKNSPKDTAILWESKHPDGLAASLPLVVPMSTRACLAACRDLPGMLKESVAASSYMLLPLPLREQMAISFRAVLGSVASNWWKEHGTQGAEVLFAITGTADITLLERAIQEKNGYTIHALHGQATGPNFAGVSNLALFRSKHDATAYSPLVCYGCCDVQAVPQPSALRGAAGILLLSNLAHPMNSDFRRQPLQDELALLDCVGSAARLLGSSAYPLLWKPHPVITELSQEMRTMLRSAAQQQGFTELPPEAEPARAAEDCRWVLSSPSTVALDLLQAGYLSVILDPQGSVLDTALSGLPQAPVEPEALANILDRLRNRETYNIAFADAFSQIGPARVFDLTYGVSI